MLYALPGWLKGPLAVLLILINTLFWFPLLLALALAKLSVPLSGWRRLCTAGLTGIANNWIGANCRFMDALHRIDWQITGVDNLDPEGWYLVTCNHQSWADIPVIQYALNRRIPLLKFFLKRQLIWVPLLGVAWWALDFPFMKRYSREQLEKHPELRGRDLETTRQACEKFREKPVTVFNFVEGTRRTPAKVAEQKPPFRNLLKPKAGGTAFVLGAMGEKLHTLLDVTIVYPDEHPSFWGLLSGRIRRIVIHVRALEIPPEFLGRDYMNDEAFREDFQRWITRLWQDKDRLIEELRHSGPREML